MRQRKPNLSTEELQAPFSGVLGDQFPPILRPAQLAALLNLSPKTIYQWIAAGRLDGAFRKRGKHNLIWRDRALDILFNLMGRNGLVKKAPRIHVGDRVMEIQKVLLAANPRLKLQLALLAFSGMRSGELQRLRQEDVDLDQGWIHVVSREGAETKTRTSRKVPIHKALLALLAKNEKSPGPWYFTAEASGKYPNGDHVINTKKLNEAFVGLAKKLKLPTGRKLNGYTIHSLRHFFETFCVNTGIPQRVIDTWLGHRSDKSMAAVYYRLADDESQSFMCRVPFSTDTPVPVPSPTEV